MFRWPTPQNGISAAPDAGPAAPGFWTAVFDYEATADDELSLRRGDLVEVLSKDSLVSGDEGWWTGMIADRVGIFPCNYVSKGNGIPEEIRDAPEQQYSVPPLHREYPIVLHPWSYKSGVLSPKRSTGLPLSFCQKARETHVGSAVSLQAQCTPVGLETGWPEHPHSFRTIIHHTACQTSSRLLFVRPPRLDTQITMHNMHCILSRKII